jgi:hypothetical protein
VCWYVAYNTVFAADTSQILDFGTSFPVGYTGWPVNNSIVLDQSTSPKSCNTLERSTEGRKPRFQGSTSKSRDLMGRGISWRRSGSKAFPPYNNAFHFNISAPTPLQPSSVTRRPLYTPEPTYCIVRLPSMLMWYEGLFGHM